MDEKRRTYRHVDINKAQENKKLETESSHQAKKKKSISVTLEEKRKKKKVKKKTTNTTSSFGTLQFPDDLTSASPTEGLRWEKIG